jgi:hypothetical protein
MSGLVSLFRGPEKPGPAPTNNSEEVRRREAERRMQAAIASGRGSTILTGERERTGEGGLAPLGTKTLLGS